MNFPESVLEIAKECASKHGGDCKAATDCAVSKIRKLPEYGDMVDDMVRDSIRHLINDIRHASNVLMRRDAGEYGAPAKVQASQSSALKRVAASLYTYAIGGTMLGLLKGKDLPAIADSEEAKAEGHAFNGRLVRRLMTLVKDDKSVRESVSERKLKAIFKELGSRDEAAAA